MKMNIKRVTLSGSVTKVEFDNLCRKWLVKNTTDSDIFVSFDENFKEDEAVKIASNFGQNVYVNDEPVFRDTCYTRAIYIKGTGEVEVQQICYK